MPTDNSQPNVAPPAAQTEPTAPAPNTEQQNSDSTGSNPAAPTGTDLGAEDPAPAAEGTDLGAEDAPAEAAPGAAYQGAPETDYEINLPDGTALDTELLNEAGPIARELNLNQAGMNKLVELKLADSKRAVARWQGHLGQLRTEAQADPTIGGERYAPAVASAKSVIAKYGDAELRKVMNDYGVGAHRAMIRFLAKIGAATSESPTVEHGAATGGVKKPLHEVMYKD